MMRTPGRRYGSPSPQKAIPEGPILDFTQLIDETNHEDWQNRVSAFEALAESIPDGSAYLNGTAWYNTPKTLSHLHRSVAELIKDPRSTVVRRLCTALTGLFRKCQSDARLLFKDLMPTILIVQGQTVQVIRQAVQTMVLDAITEVPCKSVMPLWMDRLKDKSPAVRDAASLYLGKALQSWTEAGYLTDEIWLQVGNCLLKTMRDPSPTVRQNAKDALLHMQSDHPRRFKALQSDPNGPIAQDPKLKRWLVSLGTDEQNEDLSIASKYTYNSESRFIPKNSGIRISSPRVKLNNSMSDDESGPTRQRVEVPFSIQVTTKEPVKSGTRLGPPVRLKPPTARGTPPRPPVPIVKPPEQIPEELDYTNSSTDIAMKEVDAILNEGPFIASMNELKLHASRRRSRNSLLMQERFQAEPPKPPTSSNDSASAPEHIVIAIRLLRAHKNHVDQIMETLKMEMDTLRDFDKLLEEAGRPSAEELLNYYESVDLCLEQRLSTGRELRQEMDRISAGDPPSK